MHSILATLLEIRRGALALGLISTVAGATDALAAPPKAKAAKSAPTVAAPAAKGPRELTITVTEEGYTPDSFTVTKGQPLALVVTRKTDATCATDLLIGGTDIKRPLPLNVPVRIEWTPTKAGKVTFGCAMDMMVSGVLLVEDAPPKPL